MREYSMRETRETALLHAGVQSPIRPHNHRQLHQFMLIQIFNKVAVA